MSNRHRLPEWLRVFSPRMSACQIISACFSRKQEGKGYVVALASNEVLQKRHQVASSDIAVSAFLSFFADGAAAVAQKEVARTNTLLMGMSATSTTTLHPTGPTPVSGTQSIIKQMREPLFPIASTFGRVQNNLEHVVGACSVFLRYLSPSRLQRLSPCLDTRRLHNRVCIPVVKASTFLLLLTKCNYRVNVNIRK